MSTEENNNKETKPSFNLPKLDDVKNIFNKVHDFDLRQKIRDTREKVNEEIEHHPALALISKIHAPKKWAKDLDDTVYDFSEQFNKDDVYLSSLCRSHEDLIIGSVAFSNFIVLRSKFSSCC